MPPCVVRPGLSTASGALFCLASRYRWACGCNLFCGVCSGHPCGPCPGVPAPWCPVLSPSVPVCCGGAFCLALVYVDIVSRLDVIVNSLFLIRRNYFYFPHSGPLHIPGGGCPGPLVVLPMTRAGGGGYRHWRSGGVSAVSSRGNKNASHHLLFKKSRKNKKRIIYIYILTYRRNGDILWAR